MRRAILGLGILGGVAALMGCPVGPPGLCDYGACDPPDGAVLDGGDSGFDAACDPSKDLKCIDETKGIFVAASGKPNGAGTKADPISTFENALQKAKANSKSRLYVCSGNYPGSIDINDPIAIYGGFSCGDWTYSGSKPAIQGDKPGYGIRVAANAQLYDLAVVGKGGVLPGESSVGVLVSGAAVVATLTRTKVSSGDGLNGADGVLVSFTTFPSQGQLDGKPASGSSGGGISSPGCPGASSSTGGKGGDNGFGGDPGLPNLGGGAGGILGQMCNGTGSGGTGTDATPSAPAPAVNLLGALNASWQPQSGSKGADGPAGQGGGGGQGAGGGGGGGGAAGGCGGAGGPGGGGGGASIAVLVADATVSLVESELVAGKGGNGGKGSAGQPPQSEYGFGGTKTGNGCNGGNGGKGGAGGAGGGGAGGISVGILYKGTKPTTDAATDGKITVGTKGNKGIGGAPGTNDGIDGVAQAVLQAP